MDKIVVYFTLFIAAIFSVYTVTIWPTSFNFTFIEHQLTQFTGVISLAFLTAVMLLAIKPSWLTDKLVKKSQCYRLHKQFGIGSGIALVIHWLIANDVVLTQWLFGDFIQNVGEEIGEVILFVLLPLIAVGLSRLIRVKVIRQIHSFGSIVFIGSALHAVLMLESGISQILFSSVVISLSIIGLVSALLSLIRNKSNISALHQTLKSFCQNECYPVLVSVWKWTNTQLQNVLSRKAKFDDNHRPTR